MIIRHTPSPFASLTTWPWRYGMLLVTAWSWLQGVQAWAQASASPAQTVLTTPALPQGISQSLGAFISPDLPADQHAKLLAQLTQQVQATPLRGFLYEAARGTQRVYIYGTSEWGLPDPTYFPLSAPLLGSLSASSYLLTLVDLDMTPPAQDTVLRMATYPDDDHLASHLSPALLARLNTRMQAWGRPMQPLTRLKPWFLADMVSSQSLYNQGWRKHVSSENVIVGLAHSMGKPIHVVESWQAWAQALDQMPPSLQQGLLSQALRDSENTQQREQMQQLFSAWMQSDMSGLERYVAAQGAGAETVGTPVDARANAWLAYRQRVFFRQRNQHVIDVLEQLGQQQSAPAPGFLALPAPYLAGADGLLALMQARDFTLKTLPVPTP